MIARSSSEERRREDTAFNQKKTECIPILRYLFFRGSPANSKGECLLQSTWTVAWPIPQQNQVVILPWIAVAWLLDIKEKDTVSMWARGESDSVQWIQSSYLHNPLIYKKSIPHATLSNLTKRTHIFPVINCSCSSRSWWHMYIDFDAECTFVSRVLSSAWKILNKSRVKYIWSESVFIWKNFRECWDHLFMTGYIWAENGTRHSVKWVAYPLIVSKRNDKYNDSD